MHPSPSQILQCVVFAHFVVSDKQPRSIDFAKYKKKKSQNYWEFTIYWRKKNYRENVLTCFADITSVFWSICFAWKCKTSSCIAISFQIIFHASMASQSIQWENLNSTEKKEVVNWIGLILIEFFNFSTTFLPHYCNP